MKHKPMKTNKTNQQPKRTVRTIATDAEDAIAAAESLDEQMNANKVADPRKGGYGFPYITTPDANADFKRKFKKNDFGSNEDNMLDVFLRATEHLSTSVGSFTFDDIAKLLRIYQFPNLELKALFDRWVEAMERVNKLQRVKVTCYDTDVYLFC